MNFLEMSRAFPQLITSTGATIWLHFCLPVITVLGCQMMEAFLDPHEVDRMDFNGKSRWNLQKPARFLTQIKGN